MPSSPPPRNSVADFVGALRAPELVIAAATVVVPVAAWFAYLLRAPQQPGMFALVAGGALAVGALTQMLLWAFVRAPGSLRERLALSSLSGSQPPVYMLAVAAPVVVGIILLVVTPPTTSMAVIDPDFSTFTAIALLTLLGIAASTMGGAVVFWVVAVPIALLAAVALRSRPGAEPASRTESGRRTGTVIDGVSGPEAVTFALTIVAAAAFAVSIGFASRATGTSTRASMVQQFVDVVTLRGAALPTVTAALSVVAVVVLVVLHRRFQRRRERGAGSRGPVRP